MNYSRSMTDYKRLAGIGSSYDAWKSPSSLTESTLGGKKPQEVSAPKMTLERSRIRRMANMLEDEGLGGRLLPRFDPERIDRLMEDQANPASKKAVEHHWNARFATNQAHEVDRAGDSQASHQHHAHAAEQHRKAAKHLAAAGDIKTANIHDQWAQHHDAHAAAHARRMGGTDHTAHGPTGHDAEAEKAAPAAKSKVKKKGGLLSKLKSKLAPKGAKIDWGKEAAKTEPKVKPVGVEKDPFKGSAPKKAKKEPSHSERATAAGADAQELATNKHVGSEHKAAAYKNASHEHLHAALASFHGGDHEKALTHFNAAIHHMNKHHEHMSDVAGQQRQSARNKAPVGPRARVGMARA